MLCHCFVRRVDIDELVEKEVMAAVAKARQRAGRGDELEAQFSISLAVPPLRIGEILTFSHEHEGQVLAATRSALLSTDAKSVYKAVAKVVANLTVGDRFKERQYLKSLAEMAEPAGAGLRYPGRIDGVTLSATGILAFSGVTAP